MNFRRTLKSAVLAITIAFAGTSVLAADLKIGLVQINQQALFFNQMNKGAKAAADAAGVELFIFNANNDPGKQADAIETYIAEGVDGLVVVAIDVNGVMPSVIDAAAAGIPVVAVDAILPEGPQKAQVGVDNTLAAKLLATHLIDHLGDSGFEGVELGIVGALNSFIQNVRQKGFEDGISDDSRIKTVGAVDGRNSQDNALRSAENLITANPGIDVIYATGEPALVGAIAAVESQGRTDDIEVIGWDLTGEVIAGIDAGYVTAVIQQDPTGMGNAAINSVLRSIAGEAIEYDVAVPVTIVTKYNVDPYREVFK
ncbi:MAG: substrate-binding domain-containing protein [Gammaproteobacteria bacterium]|nr:substrate-binding domain-containing protein [Gammaproteobacteria bacterium]